MEVRPFGADDAEAVWELHNAALEDAGVHGGPGAWEDDLRDIPGVYQRPGGEFLVGFAQGSLVAMGGLRRLSPEEAEITRMRVDPEYQGHVLGRHLLAER